MKKAPNRGEKIHHGTTGSPSVIVDEVASVATSNGSFRRGRVEQWARLQQWIHQRDGGYGSCGEFE